MPKPMDSTRITLRDGALRAVVVPALGGSLASLFTVGAQGRAARHWMRPAAMGRDAQGSPLAMASFPLLPWANRIRGGAFQWDGRRVQLHPGPHRGPHALHGIGWLHPWSVAACSQSEVTLHLACDGQGDWPFPFAAAQTYSLEGGRLVITLSLQNRADQAMPADIGHHPYFPHDRAGAGTRIRARVNGIWETDGDVLPTHWKPDHAAVQALQSGMDLREFDLDNNFTGFDGRAEVLWPDGARLVMRSSEPMRYFVVFSPRNQDFFCMEAVSNCTDWLNLASAGGLATSVDFGGHVLAPGQTLRGTLGFEVHAPTSQS